MYDKQSLETFANYQDVKTKTLNWCDKLQKSGLLNSEQYDSCVTTFQDATSGVLPKEFKSPNTGMERNYSLYDTRTKELSSNVSGENTNIVMLVTHNGLYMGCKNDNSLYFISDINDSKVNQQEIYYTLIPQSNNIYMIMSSYGKYLIANSGPSTGDSTIPKSQSSRQDWCAAFTGKSMGPMTNWNVKVLESDNNNNNQVTFESVQLSNFFLSSSQNTEDDSLIISYGNDDTNIWKMIPKDITTSKSETTNYSAEYIVAKDNILASYSKNKAEIICVNAFKDALINLKDTVKNNYINIENYVYEIMNNQIPNDTNTNTNTNNTIAIKKPLNRDPNKYPIEDPNEDAIEDSNNKDSFEGFKEEANINMTTNDKTTVTNNIINMKNDYIQQIDEDISNIDIMLSELKKKESDINNDYNTYTKSISNKISELKNKIKQNNIIMDRQKTNYDELNNDFSYFDSKKEKSDKQEKTAELNINLISNYSNNNSLLTKVYPFIIFIIILCLLYLIYVTYKKFMINIYPQYSS